MSLLLSGRSVCLPVLAALALAVPARAADKNPRPVRNRSDNAYTLTLVGMEKGATGWATIEDDKGAPLATLKGKGDKFIFKANSTCQITFVRGSKGFDLDMELTRNNPKNPNKFAFSAHSKKFEPCVEIKAKQATKIGDFWEASGIKAMVLSKPGEELLDIYN